MTVLAMCLAAYLLAEACATHEVLGELRHELLKEEGSTMRVCRARQCNQRNKLQGRSKDNGNRPRLLLKKFSPQELETKCAANYRPPALPDVRSSFCEWN